VYRTPIAVNHPTPFITITAKLFNMKNFILLLLSVTVLASCKKDTTSYIGTDPNSIDKATLISSGKLAFSDDRYTESVVKVYMRQDAMYVLALEQMNYETVNEDINVYLSSSLLVTTTSLKIYSAKKLHGDIDIPLSSGVSKDLPAFKYIIIQADTDKNAVATATLE